MRGFRGYAIGFAERFLELFFAESVNNFRGWKYSFLKKCLFDLFGDWVDGIITGWKCRSSGEGLH